MRRLLTGGRSTRHAVPAQLTSSSVLACRSGGQLRNTTPFMNKPLLARVRTLVSGGHFPNTGQSSGPDAPHYRSAANAPQAPDFHRPVGWYRSTARTKSFVSAALSLEGQLNLAPSELLGVAIRAQELLLAVTKRDSTLLGPASVWIARKANTHCLIAGCRAAAVAAERACVPKAPFYALVRALVVTYAEDSHFDADALENLLRDARYFDRQLIMNALGETLQADWAAVEARRAAAAAALGDERGDGAELSPELFARWRPALLTVHHLLLAMAKWALQASEPLSSPPSRMAATPAAAGLTPVGGAPSSSSFLAGGEPRKPDSPSLFMNSSAMQTYAPAVPAAQALYLQLQRQRATQQGVGGQAGRSFAPPHAELALGQTSHGINVVAADSPIASEFAGRDSRRGTAASRDYSQSRRQRQPQEVHPQAAQQGSDDAALEGLRGSFRVMRTMTSTLGLLFSFPPPAAALLVPTITQALAHAHDGGLPPRPWPFPRHPAWVDAQKESEDTAAQSPRRGRASAGSARSAGSALAGQQGSFASPTGGIIGVGAQPVKVGNHNRIWRHHGLDSHKYRGNRSYDADNSVYNGARDKALNDVQPALHKYVLHLLAAVHAAAAVRPNVLLGLSQEAPTLALLAAAASVLRVDAALRMLLHSPGSTSAAGASGIQTTAAAHPVGLLAQRVPAAPVSVFGDGGDPFAPVTPAGAATPAARLLAGARSGRMRPNLPPAPSPFTTVSADSAKGAAYPSASNHFGLQPHPLLRQLHAACVALQASRVAALGPYHSTSAGSFSLFASSRWETAAHSAVMAVVAERSPRLEDPTLVPVRHPLLETGQRPDAAWPLYRVCIEYDGSEYHAADAASAGGVAGDRLSSSSSARSAAAVDDGEDEDTAESGGDSLGSGSVGAASSGWVAISVAAQAAVVASVCERMRQLLPARTAAAASPDGGPDTGGAKASLWQPPPALVEKAGDISIDVPLRLVDAAAAARVQALRRADSQLPSNDAPARIDGPDQDAPATAKNHGGSESGEPVLSFRLRQWVGAISLDRWLVRLHRNAQFLRAQAASRLEDESKFDCLGGGTSGICPLCKGLRSSSLCGSAGDSDAKHTEKSEQQQVAGKVDVGDLGVSSAAGAPPQADESGALVELDPWAGDVSSDSDDHADGRAGSREKHHEANRFKLEETVGTVRKQPEERAPGTLPLPPRSTTCRFAIRPLEAERLAQLLLKLARDRFPEAHSLSSPSKKAATTPDAAAEHPRHDAASLDAPGGSSSSSSSDAGLCSAPAVAGAEQSPPPSGTTSGGSIGGGSSGNNAASGAASLHSQRQNERTRRRDEMMRAYGWRVVTITTDEWNRWMGPQAQLGPGHAAWDARSFSYSRKLPREAKEEIAQRLIEAGLPLSR